MAIILDVPSVGDDAVATLPAVSTHYYNVGYIIYSYNAVPSSTGALVVTVDGVPVFDHDIRTAGLQTYTFPITALADQEIEVILVGETGLQGKLSINYDIYPAS